MTASATQTYIDFMSSSRRNAHGKTFQQILNYSEEEMEFDHEYIQWLFPLPEPSPYNPLAPVINVAELQVLLTDQIKHNLELAANKMLDFWGIEPWNPQKLPILNGHNALRFSRVLQSLVYHGYRTKAEEILQKALSVSIPTSSQKKARSISSVISSIAGNTKPCLRPSRDRVSGLTYWETAYLTACERMEENNVSKEPSDDKEYIEQSPEKPKDTTKKRVRYER